jgi:hypothetical protein
MNSERVQADNCETQLASALYNCRNSSGSAGANCRQAAYDAWGSCRFSSAEDQGGGRENPEIILPDCGPAPQALVDCMEAYGPSFELGQESELYSFCVSNVSNMYNYGHCF